MTTPALDTSGVVRACAQLGSTVHCRNWDWSDLTPFAQGYVEAMFAEQRSWNGRPVLPVPAPEGSSPSQVVEVGFSDLAPEALALILEDCDRWLRLYAATPSDAANGARFWELRNLQLVTRHDFPPLRAHLGGDGKVALSQASGEGA